jgi:hypothetical protein
VDFDDDENVAASFRIFLLCVYCRRRTKHQINEPLPSATCALEWGQLISLSVVVVLVVDSPDIRILHDPAATNRANHSTAL